MSRYRELVERGEAATEFVTRGPWFVDGCLPWQVRAQSDGGHHRRLNVDEPRAKQDAAFIASARSLVPEMAAALREADARIEELEQGLRDAEGSLRRISGCCDRATVCGRFAVDGIRSARALVGSIQEPERKP